MLLTPDAKLNFIRDYIVRTRFDIMQDKATLTQLFYTKLVVAGGALSLLPTKAGVIAITLLPFIIFILDYMHKKRFLEIFARWQHSVDQCVKAARGIEGFWSKEQFEFFEEQILTKKEELAAEESLSRALLALGGQLNNDRVLHLGDGKCTDDANAYNVKGNKKNLFNLHSSGDRGGRTIFEQWLFMRAVVKLTGASLLVSERTGLSDLFALAGGIPICQFVPPTRDINPRLGQVFESGCGMGAAVWFQGKSNVDCTAMKLACETAVAEKKMLCEAICKKQSNEISSTEKCVSY